MNEQPTVLGELLELAAYFSGRKPQTDSKIYADLDINGGDFIEFIEEVERRYGVDLAWVSPRDRRANAADPTIEALAEDVLRQRP